MRKNCEAGERSRGKWFTFLSHEGSFKKAIGGMAGQSEIFIEHDLIKLLRKDKEFLAL